MVLCDIADLEQWGLYQHRAQGNCKFRERKDLNRNVLQPQIRGKDWTSDQHLKPTKPTVIKSIGMEEYVKDFFSRNINKSGDGNTTA